MSKTIYLLLALFLAFSTLPAFANLRPVVKGLNHETVGQLSNDGLLSALNNGLEQLNQSMQTTLRLSPEQLNAIRKTNRKFWQERQAIIEQPGKIARYTALLAAWDRWARQLELSLDKYQYKAFLEWQYEVSPLSEQPY